MWPVHSPGSREVVLKGLVFMVLLDGIDRKIHTWAYKANTRLQRSDQAVIKGSRLTC